MYFSSDNLIAIYNNAFLKRLKKLAINISFETLFKLAGVNCIYTRRTAYFIFQRHKLIVHKVY